MTNDAMRALLKAHAACHRGVTAQDEVMLVLQALMGGSVPSEEDAAVYQVRQEEADLSPDGQEPLTEPLGLRFMRLNLRRAMAEGIRPEWIVRLMRQTPTGITREEALAALDTLSDAAEKADWKPIVRRMQENPDWLPKHSESYAAANAPAYRIIGRSALALLPVLGEAARQWHKPRLLVAIDGPCGSGKTTLANRLSAVLNAPCVRMDHFFLPHALKTPERLAQPGGNADLDRLLGEFFAPWLSTGCASYRPYDCHRDCLSAPVDVPANHVTILEGSYSLYPSVARYADLHVFLQIDPEEQRRRIIARNGMAGWVQFADRWIPLERAYFDAFHLPDASCLTLQPPQEA